MVRSLKLSILSLFFVSNALCASFYEATLQGVEGKSETITTRFPYHCLTAEDREQLLFVPEGMYARVGSACKAQSAVVGPLSPCVFVGVRSEQLDSTLAFHINDGNDGSSVTAVLDREFGADVPADSLKAVVYTNSVKGLPEGLLQQMDTSPVKQKGLLMSALTALVEKYGLKKDQITAVVFGSQQFPPVVSTYEGAARSVFVTKDLEVSSVSLLAEGIFADAPQISADLPRKMDEVVRGYGAVAHHHVDRFFRGVRPVMPVPVMRVPDSQTGLARVREITGL